MPEGRVSYNSHTSTATLESNVVTTQPTGFFQGSQGRLRSGMLVTAVGSAGATASGLVMGAGSSCIASAVAGKEGATYYGITYASSLAASLGFVVAVVGGAIAVGSAVMLAGAYCKARQEYQNTENTPLIPREERVEVDGLSNYQI